MHEYLLRLDIICVGVIPDIFDDREGMALMEMRLMKRITIFTISIAMLIGLLGMVGFTKVYAADSITIARATIELQSDSKQQYKDVAFTATTAGTMNVTISGDPGCRYKTFINGTESLYIKKDTCDYSISAGDSVIVRFYCYDKTLYTSADGTVSYTVTFTETQNSVVQKEEKAISDIKLNVGKNTLTLDPQAVTTIYEFEPTDNGVYTFTVDQNDALVGYWGAGSFYTYDYTADAKTNTLEFIMDEGERKEIVESSTGNVISTEWVSPSIMIGVSGAEGSFTLTVERTGDAEQKETIQYVDYKNKHTPDTGFELVLEQGQKLTKVDITKQQTVVLGSDGYYHINSSKGPVLYVDLISTNYDLTTACGGGAFTLRGIYTDENGEEYYYEFLRSMGQYAKALDGEGRYPLTEDLVIFLKAFGSSQGWYMPELSMYNEIKSGNFYENSAWLVNCYYIPGTGSVEENEVVKPSFSVLSKTLNLECDVKYNMIFMANNTSSVKNMGLITFLSNPSDVSIDSADYVIPGAVSTSGMYMVGSQGIPAKNLGDTLYMVIYAELTDGSYAYSSVVPYSAKDYAYAQLGNSGITENQRKLLVAMLNYGAEAQLAFGYNTDNLINADLAAMEIPEMVTYSNDLLDGCVSADDAKTGNFPTGGFHMNSATVSLEGALAINYLLMPANTPSAGMKVYYWTADTYNSASKLTIDNADGTLDSIVSSGMYMATYNGLAASQMGDTVYVAAVYENGGNTYTTGVISYSLAKYLTATADGIGEQKNLAAATVIYGYYANIEFPNV